MCFVVVNKQNYIKPFIKLRQERSCIATGSALWKCWWTQRSTLSKNTNSSRLKIGRKPKGKSFFFNLSIHFQRWSVTVVLGRVFPKLLQHGTSWELPKTNSGKMMISILKRHYIFCFTIHSCSGGVEHKFQYIVLWSDFKIIQQLTTRVYI